MEAVNAKFNKDTVLDFQLCTVNGTEKWVLMAASDQTNVRELAQIAYNTAIANGGLGTAWQTGTITASDMFTTNGVGGFITNEFGSYAYKKIGSTTVCQISIGFNVENGTVTGFRWVHPADLNGQPRIVGTVEITNGAGDTLTYNVEPGTGEINFTQYNSSNDAIPIGVGYFLRTTIVYENA